MSRRRKEECLFTEPVICKLSVLLRVLFEMQIPGLCPWRLESVVWEGIQEATFWLMAPGDSDVGHFSFFFYV